MKSLIGIGCVILGLTIGCTPDVKHRLKRRSSAIVDTVVVYDTMWMHDTLVRYVEANWQKNLNITQNPEADTIFDRAVEEYLNNPSCDALAFDFYYGSFKPGDNALTSEFIDLIFTKDEQLRPFYLWCFHKTIEMSDGALAEMLGSPARRFISKQPILFLNFISRDEFKSGYGQWIEIINYSGLHDYQYDSESAYQDIFNSMKANCSNCSDSTLQVLKGIALDIRDYSNN